MWSSAELDPSSVYFGFDQPNMSSTQRRVGWLGNAMENLQSWMGLGFPCRKWSKATCAWPGAFLGKTTPLNSGGNHLLRVISNQPRPLRSMVRMEPGQSLLLGAEPFAKFKCTDMRAPIFTIHMDGNFGVDPSWSPNVYCVHCVCYVHAWLCVYRMYSVAVRHQILAMFSRNWKTMS